MGQGTDIALWIASVIGAIALYLMMPRRGFNPRNLGALLGAMTLGGLWLYLSRLFPAEQFGGARMVYYYVFSALAVVAAVRVITHTKPIYSALWFVMVILSSAGLLLLLGAEFMAFAMVIIYAGAILVTYMFVIMLATQGGDPAGGGQSPEYERVAREPAAAIAAGFLLMAMLLTAVVDVHPANPRAAGDSDQRIIAGVLPDRAAGRLQEKLAGEAGTAAVVEAFAQDQAGQLTNVERVGLDLFRSHPLGLELAGVILLVSLIGAVVIARQKVEKQKES